MHLSHHVRDRENVQLDMTDWQELDDRLVTKWRFKCILSLPWRPVLAAAGGTQHVFDPVRSCLPQYAPWMLLLIPCYHLY